MDRLCEVPGCDRAATCSIECAIPGAYPDVWLCAEHYDQWCEAATQGATPLIALQEEEE